MWSQKTKIWVFLCLSTLCKFLRNNFLFCNKGILILSSLAPLQDLNEIPNGKFLAQRSMHEILVNSSASCTWGVCPFLSRHELQGIKSFPSYIYLDELEWELEYPGLPPVCPNGVQYPNHSTIITRISSALVYWFCILSSSWHPLTSSP